MLLHTSEGGSEIGGTGARKLMLLSWEQFHNFWQKLWLFVKNNSYGYCECYCLPLHQCEKGWRTAFFLQLLLSLNMHIYLWSMQDTNKIFRQYRAECSSLHRAKYFDILSCLSVAKEGLKITPREKHFLLCSRPNVQSGGSVLGGSGGLGGYGTRTYFCQHLSSSSSSLASCK